MKSILIIESEFTGHYLTGYIKYVLRSLKKKNIKIVLLITDLSLKKGKGALKILREEKVNFEIKLFPYVKIINLSKLSLIKYQFIFYFRIKEEFKKLNSIYNFDHVFLSSLQRFDKVLSILGSPFENTNFSGVLLGLKFHLKEYQFKYSETNSKLSKFLFLKLLKIDSLKFIITNDFLLKKYINSLKKNSKKKLIFLHDPKEFRYKYKKNEARKFLSINKKAFVILVYGAIIDTKGVIKLLNIFKEKVNVDIKVIIAGDQFGYTKKYLKNNYVKNLIKNKKLKLITGWQNEIDEAKLFYCADTIWIGYENYPFPSGVLYQSVAANKPPIVSKNGFIYYLNKKYNIGYVSNIDDSKKLIDTILKIKKEPNNIKLRNKIKYFRNISKPENWVKNFKRLLFKKIR